MDTQLMLHNPFWPKAFPDPFVLKFHGRYYAYATETEAHPSKHSPVFPILTSSDLVHWNDAGKALPAFGAPYHSYWAPEVTVYNGQFFLYYAVHTEEFKGGIRVAVADSPTGPFTDSGHDLTAAYLPWAIDPHVFRDQDGQWYLYITIDYWNDPITSFTGSGNAVARLLDPFTLQGDITRVTAPSAPWQLFEAQRQEKGGVDWYTVEGPTVVRHRKRYYEMFSGGRYYGENYAVSYAVSDRPMGPDGMRDTSWQDWEGTEGDPFLIHGDAQHLISPGHNSLVLGPNNVEQYLAYHAFENDMLERRPCLDRLFWHGAALWTPAPTHTPQPAPTLPRIRELFEDANLSSLWQPEGGDWQIANQAVVQNDPSLAQAILSRQENLETNWLLEVNLRLRTRNGAYGIRLHNTHQNSVDVLLTSDAHLRVGSANSHDEPLHTLALPEGTHMQAWHQLILSCSGSVLVLQFDGLSLLEVLLEDSIASFSLLTESCQAAFSAISLTDHYRDEFLNNNHTPTLLGWRVGRGEQAEVSAEKDTLADWRVRDGMLEQTSSELGTHILLKGSSYKQHEFSCTLRLQQSAEHEEAGLGCVLWHSRAEQTFILLSQHSDQWKLIVELTNDLPGTNIVLDLPAAFNPQSWHTLRLECQSNQLSIYLDGPQIFTHALLTRAETVGLVTRHASAAFMSVEQTGR